MYLYTQIAYRYIQTVPAAPPLAGGLPSPKLPNSAAARPCRYHRAAAPPPPTRPPSQPAGHLGLSLALTLTLTRVTEQATAQRANERARGRRATARL